MKLISSKFMIRFLHGKEEPSKVCPSPKVWLRSSVVSCRPPSIWETWVPITSKPEFSRFTFLCCNCLNFGSSTYIQGSLLNTIFTRRLNKIYFTKKKIMESNTNDFSTYLGVYRQPVLSLSSHRAQAFCFVST